MEARNSLGTMRIILEPSGFDKELQIVNSDGDVLGTVFYTHKNESVQVEPT